MKRPKIAPESVEAASSSVRAHLNAELHRKGVHSLASTHEILGIIDEEHDELKDAVKANDLVQVRKELHDIAVAATFSLSCIEQGTLDW